MQPSDNKIKLILITPSLKIGGSQRVIIYLCNNLGPKIFDITLIIINNQISSNSFPIESIKDVKIIDFKTPRVRNALFKIIKAIRKIQPDIIFSTQYHLNTAMLLTKPFLPRRGIQEIILITFEVQKGIVQSRNRTICTVIVLTSKRRK